MNTQVNWKDYTKWTDTEIKGFFGKDDFRWLSNFAPAYVEFECSTYSTSEHAYMASKTLCRHERTNIQMLDTPKQARDYGQTVTLRPNWDNVKADFMLAISFDKFWRNYELRKKLLDTNDKYLEETNHWHDNFWGNCICENCKNLEGKNMLGKIIMKVRQTFLPI